MPYNLDVSIELSHGWVPLLRVSLSGDEKSNAVLFKVDTISTSMLLLKSPLAAGSVVVLARSRPGVLPFTSFSSWIVFIAGGVLCLVDDELALFGLSWSGVTWPAVCEPLPLVAISSCTSTSRCSITYEGDDDDDEDDGGGCGTGIAILSASVDSQLSGRLLDFFTMALFLLGFG